jgi:hypothetical protein
MLKTLRLVTSASQSEQLASRLLAKSSCVIGLDSEGVRLGRFGRLSLLQVAEETGDVSLMDAKNDGVIQAFGQVLTSPKITKVMHDCREDSASIFHQYNGIRLANVFDTQVASLLLQRKRKEKLRQEGYSDLIEKLLGIPPDNDSRMKERMMDDPFLWHKRPLSAELVKYAVLGVEYLIPLWKSQLNQIKHNEMSVEEVLGASDCWVEYCGMNADILKPTDAEKVGTPLLGMVASITDKGVFFKLNIGRTGVCSTTSAMRRMLTGSGGFPVIEVGDIVELAVSGASMDGKIIYVDRRDPDWEYFDFFRRPSPEKRDCNEYKHVPSLFNKNVDVDPLLRRGLGDDGCFDSDGEGEVDHDPILTKKPSKLAK